MQLRSALLAATVLATPIAASAQPVTGLYVGAGAGVNIMPNIQVNPNTIFGVGTANLKSEVGFAGVVSMGGASATVCALNSRATTGTTPSIVDRASSVATQLATVASRSTARW